ncbi:MAG: ferri-bacillibactin esterase BesA [Paenibacillus sp.]|nr:ferri-bacillibactin esterase BesA [Paenibacillus sp.]
MEQQIPYSVPGTVQRTMHSRNGNREYRIFVFKPAQAAPPTGYPVIYLLDANSIFASVAEAVRLQSRRAGGVEPFVIVGIGYPTDEPFSRERRFFDYTVEATLEQLPHRPDGFSLPATGGAELFLDFIEAELKPSIEREIPIDRKRQSLFGHSLGGLYALHVLFTRPGLFQAYIAGSPSIWWKNKYLFDEAQQLRSRMDQAGAAVSLMIAVGGQEKPFMIEDAERMSKSLSSARIPGLRLAYSYFGEEGHVSVLPPIISAALRFMSGSAPAAR